MGIKKFGLLLLILMGVGCGSAPSDTLNMNVNCGLDYKAVPGQPIEVNFGAWGALEEDLVMDNASHLSVTFELDGEAVDVEREAVMSCEDAMQYQCRVPSDYCEDGSFWIIHRVTLDPLDPGEYDVVITHSFDEVITDGYDSDGDGVNDTYGPGLWSRRSYTVDAS